MLSRHLDHKQLENLLIFQLMNFFYVVKRYLFSRLGEFSLYHSINENLMFLKRLWNTKIKLMNFNTSPSGNEIQVQTN